MQTLISPAPLPVKQPIHTSPPPDLADEIRRLRSEEQAKIDRQRQEELARLRELARYD